MAALGVLPALIYEALWCMADDSGVAECDPDRIKAEMFYNWSEVSEGLIVQSLDILEGAKRIRRYAVSGDTYCELPKFLVHQKIHKPSAFRYPRDSGTSEAPVPHYSSTTPAPVPLLVTSNHILVTSNQSLGKTSRRRAARGHTNPLPGTQASGNGISPQPGGWPAEIAGILTAVGPCAPGHVGKLCRPYVTEHGDALVLRAAQAFVKHVHAQPIQKAQFLKPATFLANIGTWIDYVTPGGARRAVGDTDPDGPTPLVPSDEEARFL